MNSRFPVLNPALTFCLTCCLVLSGLSSQRAIASEASHLDSVFPKTVKLFGAGGLRNLGNYGTGFFVSPDGHILTVWNHLLDTEDVVAVLDSGRRLPARFLSGTGEAGLAILKVEVRNAPYFDLNQATQCGAGTPVFAFSNVFNVAAGDEPVSVMHGVVATVCPLNARRGRFEVAYKKNVYIVDAITNNPGGAGGALTTRDGSLLGIVGKELRDSRTNLWINYAIPIVDIRETIQQLIRGEVVTDSPVELPKVIQPLDTSPLGFTLVPDIVARTPAFVESVQAGSPAEAMGLLPDDLIVLMNEDLVQTCQEFQERLQRLKKGDTLRLTVRRDRELISFELIMPQLN